MTWYLVEAYSPPGDDLAEIDARIGRSVDTVAGIVHLGSVLLVEDETCFLFFDADDRDTVAGVTEMADLASLRIVETLHTGGWG